MAQDLQILSRLRPDAPEVAALRWSVSPKAGFPAGGFKLVRNVAGNETQILTAWRLPGAVHTPQGEWLIDRMQLQADLGARTTPHGIPLPSGPSVDAMAPLLTFALEQPDEAELQADLPAVATLSMNSHEFDLGLIREFWSSRPIVDIAQISAMRNSAVPADASLYRAVIRYYRANAITRLLFHAADFGMAKCLGLGFDDLLPEPVPTQLSYELTADYSTHTVTSRCYPESATTSWPPAPARPTCVAGQTFVGYPDLAPFYGVGASPWLPALPVGAPSLLIDLLTLAQEGPRKYSSPLADVSWPADVPSEGDDDDSVLLPRSAVFWRIERSEFGPASAMSEAQPAVSGSTIFTFCHDGRAVPAAVNNRFRDDVDIPWGEKPMEGWYAYRVSGVDVFGIGGKPSAPGLVLLRDTFAPAPPGISVDHERLEIPETGSLSVTVDLDWTAENEFCAPDAEKFRVFQDWTPLETTVLRVLSVEEIKETGSAWSPLNVLLSDIEVSDEAGRPIDSAALKALSGGTLRAMNSDFQIVEAPAGSMLRVRRSAGRAPSPGPACAVTSGSTASGTIATVLRSKPLTGRVVLDSVDPLQLHLVNATTGEPMELTPGRLRLHILQHTFGVEAIPGGLRYLVKDPSSDGDTRGSEILQALFTLSAAEMAAFLNGSPGILLPANEVSITLQPPQSNFVTGTVRLSVTAADNAPYQQGPHGMGNEGLPEAIIRTVRVARKPITPPWRPKKCWAHAAAQFASKAAISLSWPPFATVASYQVERALESALNCSASSQDDVLLNYAATAAADSAFERITERAFLPEWIDELPGEAPTRAVYRVRGISAAGVPSDWLVFALVRVPDIRLPPPPNFLTARPPSGGQDRVIECVWTHGGPREGIGFIIEARDANVWLIAEEGWREVAEVLPGAVAPGTDRRFRLSIQGQRPGCPQDLRVRAVRHALDPDDPRALNERRLRGGVSRSMRAVASGRVLGARDVKLRVDGGGHATLRWTNADIYQKIEVQVREPGRFGFDRVGIEGDATYWEKQLTKEGNWSFRLVAVGWGSQAVSEVMDAEWAR